MRKLFIILISCILLFSCSSPVSSSKTDNNLNDLESKLRWKECSISENIINMDWSSIYGAAFYRVYYLEKYTDSATVEEIRQNNMFFDSDPLTSEISILETEQGYVFFYVTAIDSAGNEIQEIGEYKSFYYDPSFNWDFEESYQNNSVCTLKWTKSQGANLYFLFAYGCEGEYVPTFDEIVEYGEEFDLSTQTFSYQISEPDKTYYFVIASCYKDEEDSEILYRNENLIYAAPVSKDKLYYFEWAGEEQADKMTFRWTKSQVADHYNVYYTEGSYDKLEDFSENYKNYSKYKASANSNGISLRIDYYNQFIFCIVAACDKDDNELFTLSPNYYYVTEPAPIYQPPKQPSSGVGTIKGFNLYFANKYTNQLEAKWDKYPGATKYILYINDTSYPSSFSAEKEINLANQKRETSNNIEFFFMLKEYCHCVVEAYDSNGNVIARSKPMTGIAYQKFR